MLRARKIHSGPYFSKVKQYHQSPNIVVTGTQIAVITEMNRQIGTVAFTCVATE